jgi:hypothetical protein
VSLPSQCVHLARHDPVHLRATKLADHTDSPKLGWPAVVRDRQKRVRPATTGDGANCGVGVAFLKAYITRAGAAQCEMSESGSLVG